MYSRIDLKSRKVVVLDNYEIAFVGDAVQINSLECEFCIAVVHESSQSQTSLILAVAGSLVLY